MKRDSADWKAPKTDAVHARTDHNQLILQSMLRRCSSYSASSSCPDLSPQLPTDACGCCVVLYLLSLGAVATMTQESLPRRVFSRRVLRYSHMKRDSADWKEPKIAGHHARTDQNQLILLAMLRHCPSYSASSSTLDLSSQLATDMCNCCLVVYLLSLGTVTTMTQESLPHWVLSERVLRHSHMKRDSADWKAPESCSHKHWLLFLQCFHCLDLAHQSC